MDTIKLWNAQNTANHPYRSWKDVNIYGSTSAEGPWGEPIKSFQNLDLEINNYGFAGNLDINAAQEYTYYKIDVLDNKGDDYMQMADMKFVQADPSTIAPYDVYFPASLYNGTSAVLPANITETWADGKFNMPMYAHSESTDLQFKNLCGVLKVIVKNDRLSEVKGIRVSSANKATSGAFTVNSYNAAVLTNPTNPANTVTVTYTEAVPTTAEGTVFYVAIPAQTYRGLKIELSADGENFTKAMTTREDADIVVERNKIYPINHVMTIPSGALSGVFTVSDPDGTPNSGDEKKVHFSKGNLYYDGNKFDFEDEQYYFRTYDGKGKCDANGYDNNSGTVSGHWGLFGWSTPSTYYGISTSETSSDYSGSFVDWGAAIDNKGTWSTLSGGSNGEWTYLLDGRTVNNGTGEGYSYKRATITLNETTGVFGLILYPDNYTTQNAATDYSLAEWTTMEQDGCVFLPAAGLRFGSDIVGGVGDNGNYWSSTAPDGIGNASVVSIFSSYVRLMDGSRNTGFSVRLITESNE